MREKFSASRIAEEYAFRKLTGGQRMWVKNFIIKKYSKMIANLRIQ